MTDPKPIHTADNLTDDEIRALRNDAADHAVTVLCKYALRELACNACRRRALHGFDGQCPSCANERESARARLAEIINARAREV